MTSPQPLSLRAATVEDEALLLEWANDPATRAAGFRPAPITSAEHRAWFEDRLRSPTDRLLIGMAGDAPVGQIRLDGRPDGRIEIGIAVAPERRGQGIGRSLLRLAMDAARQDAAVDAKAFVARIRPENPTSIALFTGAGFRQVAETEVRGMRCLEFEHPA